MAFPNEKSISEWLDPKYGIPKEALKILGLNRCTILFGKGMCYLCITSKPHGLLTLISVNGHPQTDGGKLVFYPSNP